ncbi:MAG: SMP-30/gluconolactonase/LRE family protein [Acidimicrobiia bacterium]|nr:SMP-30/gluconolactonase/LRE family protein [Acidimicrobiia bacterium]
MALVESIEVLVDGLDHPEGVAVDHESGTIYAGGELGQIYAIDAKSRTFAEVARTPGFVLGLAVDGRGRVAICDSVDAAIWVLEEASLRRLIERAEDRQVIMPNYPAFGPDGTLYFSDSGRWKEDNGAVIAVDPEGNARVMDTTLSRFPNGCAVTPDGSELWVIQSLGPDVSRFNLISGGPPETVARLPGTVPDGIAFTDDGGAVISCYRPDRIYYLDPDGKLEIIAEDPEGTLLAAPTNIAFFGADRRQLVSANLGRWHLTLMKTQLTGVVPHNPETWAVDAL